MVIFWTLPKMCLKQNILMHQVTVRSLPGGSAVEGSLFRGEGGAIVCWGCQWREIVNRVALLKNLTLYE